MKLNTFFALAISAFMFSGCEELGKLDINVPLKLSYDIVYTENTPAEGFSRTETISLRDEPTIADKIEDIDEIEIAKVTYRLRNFSGNDAATVQGTFNINPGNVGFSIPVTNASAFASENREGVVTIPVEQLNALGATLKRGESLTVSSTILGENPSANVTIDLIIEVIATVEVIK